MGDQKKGLRERGGELLEIEIGNYWVGEEIKDLGIVIRVSEKGRGLKKGVIRKGEGIFIREYQGIKKGERIKNEGNLR